ncbi:hypothetical protein BDY24DRAFT_418005 [Mrakia frigida]|uniref:uncharacterized protein n=1 Tax=Mrakia frigida TaxID=29902 RepID=UPI003FCC01E6
MATPLPPTATAPPSTPTPPPSAWKKTSRSEGGAGGQARRKEDHRKKDWKPYRSRKLDMKKRAVGTGPVAEGYPDCSNVGNDQLSCFPLSNTTVVQDDYSKFIWNFNYPLFIANNNTVDIYLHLASSDELVQSWTNLPNPEGQLAFSPDDAWWESMKKSDDVPEDGANEWEVYFVIVPGGHSLNGAEVHQATFIANQTAVPSAVALSRQSTSSTASVASASRAAVASTSALSVSSIASSSIRAAAATGTNGSGSLQGNGGGDGFPKWATALLSVLGALLLLTLLGLIFIFLRRMRRRNRQGSIGSLGSSSPMMSNRDGALGVTTGAAGLGAAAGSSSDQPDRAVSPSSPQTTASSHQNPQYAQFAPSSPTNPFNSTASQASGGGQNAPSLTGADAASISAAYRSALSHPNFEEASPEGSTPEDEGAGGKAGAEVLQRELEAEGMVVRGVKGGTGGDVRDGGGV